MKVTVKRYKPAEQSYFYSEYMIDDRVLNGMTVMRLLDYITRNIDPTLGYYSHSVCYHGVCARCMLQVNGKQQLACTTRVQDYEELVLEPAKGRQPIRDLVVQLTK